METIIKILTKRLKSNSPKLFRRITNGALIIGAASGLVLTLPISLPVWATIALTLVVGISTGLAGSSKLTIEDEVVIEKNKKEISQ